MIFLQELLNKGNYKFTTLNAHRSALSLLLPGKLGEDPRIKRFMKGVANINPSTPRYAITWDPTDVIKYLENVDSSNLKQLSLKLVTLLALTTGQRLQTLSLIKLENIIESNTGLLVFVPDKIKNSASGKNQPLLNLQYFDQNPKVCVARTLKDYLNITRDLRCNSAKGPLFLAFVKPHASVTKQTLSRWIKKTLEAAGIDTNIFKPHSTRHASSSMAKRRGINVDVIQKTAGWSTKSETFARFYNRPLLPSLQYLNAIVASV